jgi:SAM-dependent methyltransferase
MALGDFTAQATAYARARPTYPAKLLDLLIDDAGVVAGDPVADFGAGTGIFTQLLVDRGLHVSAIEPNQPMRERASVSAVWLDGTFEASGLPNESQCWAVAAQAFHWADPVRALPEIRRILKRGRLFTVLWNNRANRDSEILGWTEAAIRRLVPDFDEAYRNRDWPTILESTGDFVFVNARMVQHIVPMSKERYLELWRSHNRLNTIAGPERFQQLLMEIENYLATRNVAEIQVPYRCETWPVRRK